MIIYDSNDIIKHRIMNGKSSSCLYDKYACDEASNSRRMPQRPIFKYHIAFSAATKCFAAAEPTGTMAPLPSGPIQM